MEKQDQPKVTTSILKEHRKNGEIYVWERRTQYSKEKKYTVELGRTLLGKILKDDETETVVPTRPKKKTVKTEAKDIGKDTVAATKQHVGLTDILKWIGKESGITDDLELCCDIGTAQKLETIAQFWLSNQGDRLRRIEKWQILHETPYCGELTKSILHNLFVDIGNDASLRQGYFKARANRCDPKSALALDSTTVSSYSNNLHQARQGFNKDGDGLDTVKLVTLYDLEKSQPIAYAKQPGNLADVASIQYALKQLDFLGISKVQIVTDKGYYSQDNISKFVTQHIKFLTAVPLSVKWINKELEAHKQEIEKACNTCPWDLDISGITVPIKAEFSSSAKRSSKNRGAGAQKIEEHRLYIHLYLNHTRIADDRRKLAREVMDLKNRYEQGLDGLLSESAKKRANQFLIVSRVGRGGKEKVTINEERYQEALKNAGYFALVSNQADDTFEALKKYRLREKIEESFRDTKSRLDGARTRVWDDDTLEGRMFAQFVALGYQSFFRKQLKLVKSRLVDEIRNTEQFNESERKSRDRLLKWLDSNSMQDILDWFDCVELTTMEINGKVVSKRVGDTERDRLFLQMLGVPGYEEDEKTRITKTGDRKQTL